MGRIVAVLLLTLTGLINDGSSNAVPIDSRMVRDVPVIITHSHAGIAGNTTVTTDCLSGTLKVTATTNASLIDRASIALGNGQGPCQSSIMSYQSRVEFTSSLTNTCGRRGEVGMYQWDVTLTEYLKGPLLRPLTYTFSASCLRFFGGPDDTLSFGQPNETETSNAMSYGEVHFGLIKDISASSEFIWVLRLSPIKPDDLRGLSYTISSLTASAAGSQHVVSLIENQCVLDEVGTRVETMQQVNIITIMAFRFPQVPASAIEFTATILPCQPTTLHGFCNGVKSSQECFSPPQVRRGLPNAGTAQARHTWLL